MPIKTLEPFLFENHSVGNYPIDILKNSTIGIDLSHYVSRLLTFKKEPFIDAIGGFPTTLLGNIDNDLKILNELNIKPIFVVNGLSSALGFESKQADGLNSQERVRANKWDLFNKNIKIDTFRDFRSPAKFNVFDILEFFNRQGIEYLIAPYHASQQLYYMLQKNVIDVIYGPTDLLLFPLPLEKFIFCIEFQNKEFKFLDKSYILNRLSINEKQFLEISMCVGNNYQPHNLNIFQPQQPPGVVELTFPQLHDFTINGGSIYNTILQLPLQDQFFKGLSSLKYQPILNLNGEIEIARKSEDDKLPNDLHEFLGQRLSNEYYYYQSLGITNFKLAETVLYGTYLERISADSNPHRLYVWLINDTELINKTLNLTTNFLNRYFQFKKYNLKLVLSNGPSTSLELSSRQPAPIYLSTRKFLYKDAKTTEFDLNNFFSNLTTNLKINTEALTDELRLSNNAELLGSSVIRSLYVLNLVSYNGELVKFGQLLPLIKSKESLILLLFFSRLQNQLRVGDIGTTSFEILSKILSIYPIVNLKAANYTNRISQSLLQFNLIFSKLQEQFQELLTSNLLTILFNGEFSQKFKYTEKDWYNLVSSNPFNKEFSSIITGLLSEAFFQNFTDLPTAKANLNSTFGNLFVESATPSAALILGFKWFHEEVIQLVLKMDELGLVKKDIVAAFKEADDFLVTNVLI